MRISHPPTAQRHHLSYVIYSSIVLAGLFVASCSQGSGNGSAPPPASVGNSAQSQSASQSTIGSGSSANAGTSASAGGGGIKGAPPAHLASGTTSFHMPSLHFRAPHLSVHVRP